MANFLSPLVGIRIPELDAINTSQQLTVIWRRIPSPTKTKKRQLQERGSEARVSGRFCYTQLTTAVWSSAFQNVRTCPLCRDDYAYSSAGSIA